VSVLRSVDEQTASAWPGRNVQAGTGQQWVVNETGRRAVGTLVGSVVVGIAWGVGSGTGGVPGLLDDDYRRRGN
jgi:hypothetical protein